MKLCLQKTAPSMHPAESELRLDYYSKGAGRSDFHRENPVNIALHNVSSRTRHTLSRYGGWLPENDFIGKSFLAEYGTSPRNGSGGLSEPVKAFREGIWRDRDVVDLLTQVFIQSDESNTVRDFETLLNILDNITQTAPSFYTAEGPDGQEVTEPIGIPMYLLFDLLSNTSAGYDLFRMTSFNSSGGVLNTTRDGWFSSGAVAMMEEGRGGSFNEIYVVPDPNADNRGFRTWDEFFTRAINPDKRPIEYPENKSLIHNACESTPVRISLDVKKSDKFWLKGQAYSLYDVLNRNEKYIDRFVGGAVYQAFLGPLDYHRWHAPVDGVVLDTDMVAGSFYAALPDEGEKISDGTIDPRGALLRSQPFLAASATRGIIFVKPDNPDIDVICFVGVGMAEVSTCEIKVQPGEKITTGDELGMFRFGGSTHCLIFGAKSNVVFENNVQPDEGPLWVNSVLAHVTARPVDM